MAIQDNVFYSELPNLRTRPEDGLSKLERDFFGDISIPQLMSNYSELSSTPPLLPDISASSSQDPTVSLQLAERQSVPVGDKREQLGGIGTYSTLERTSVGAHYDVQEHLSDYEEHSYAQLNQLTRREPTESHYETPVSSADRDSAGRLLKISPFPPLPPLPPLPPADVDTLYRAIHRFVPRHKDEIELVVGDELVLNRLHPDLWAECKNKRTGETGVVPNHYIAHFNGENPGIKLAFLKETFSANFIGSVSVRKSSGREVAKEAMTRILSERRRMQVTSVQPVMVEVTATGVTTHVMAPPGLSIPRIPPIHFSINQVTYSAVQGSKSLAYIVRNPQQQDKFTCYVYDTEESVELVLEIFQRAFDTYKKSKSAHTKPKV